MISRISERCNSCRRVDWLSIGTDEKPTDTSIRYIGSFIGPNLDFSKFDYAVK